MTNTDLSTKPKPARPWPWIDPETGMRRGGYRRVPHRTLYLIRWMAIGGQISSLLVIYFLLGYTLPIWPTLGVISASVLLNIMVMARRPRAGRLRDGEATGYLAFDILQLSALLYFTGGLANPFAVLVLAPVTVSATMLPRRATSGLALLAVISASVIALFHWPLPWGAETLILPRIYILGIWTAVILSTLFISAYVGSITLEGQRMQDALDAAHLALTREQRNAAVGALAAAAAHELGSPLATIAVTIKELALDEEVMKTLGGDIDILQAEIERCRDILADLGSSKDFDADDPFSVMPLSALIDAAIIGNDSPLSTIRLEASGEADSIEPQVIRSPEFLHGLGNIIKNAAQFAAREVKIDLYWNDTAIKINVQDDGPGFAPQLLDRIGEPYISTRTETGEHMGLGLFIAQTLLEQTGAALKFDNQPSGGARIELVWRRRQLEYMKS